MVNLETLVYGKLGGADGAAADVLRCSRDFSDAERALLGEILQDFDFDGDQARALVHAVRQQHGFDPDAAHIGDDDEDGAGVCAHCLNPPAPPLRDYYLWRQQRGASGQGEKA